MQKMGGKMKKNILSKLCIFFLLTLMFSLACATSNHAKPFYEEKVMKIIVTTKPGGGYDFYARLLAKFMQKHLPGSTFIIKNIPGAGHIIGTNAIYRSKPDGLTFGTFNRATGITQVAGLKGVKFDLTKMSWLGSPSSEIFGFIVHDSFKNIDGVLKADKLRIGTGGFGDLTYITTLLFYGMLGQNNYAIGTGYSGSEIALAIMRREVDGNFGSFDSRRMMVENGYGRFVLFIGKIKPAGYENVPFIQDIIKDIKHKPMIDLLIGLNMVGRPFAGPPGIPKDRLRVLRDAFKKSLNDPELLKQAEKAGKPISFTNAEECESRAKSLLSLPTDIVDKIKEAFVTK